MNNDPRTEGSDFSVSRQECSHCGAIWINGKHYWRGTAQSSKDDKSEYDLAGLVCNTPYGKPSVCINPKRGKTGGDTWAARLSYLEKLESSDN